MASRKYTPEMIQFIRENAAMGKPYMQVAAELNARFGLAVDKTKFYSIMRHYGIRNSCWFLPVGTEITRQGYIEIKIACKGKARDKWRPKHVLLWEQLNGPLPPGHVIMFADGDRSNFEPGNLLCATRAELVYMNRNRLMYNSAELNRAGLAIARRAIAVRKKMESRLGREGARKISVNFYRAKKKARGGKRE